MQRNIRDLCSPTKIICCHRKYSETISLILWLCPVKWQILQRYIENIICETVPAASKSTIFYCSLWNNVSSQCSHMLNILTFAWAHWVLWKVPNGHRYYINRLAESEPFLLLFFVLKPLVQKNHLTFEPGTILSLKACIKEQSYWFDLWIRHHS